MLALRPKNCDKLEANPEKSIVPNLPQPSFNYTGKSKTVCEEKRQSAP